jgi:geranylgeranyl pyrophosphate synthase
MAGARGVPAERCLRIVAEVAGAAGEGGMVGGQALDLAAAGRATGLARVRAIHRWKTGALLRAAVRTGALAAGADGAVLRRLTRYGEHLGLTFQIADDILDAAGAPGADGRTDQALEKATYPAVLGLDGARRAALRERDAAIAALRALGPPAEPLRAIAEYVVARTGLAPDAAGAPAGAAPPVPLARARRALRS